MNLQVVARFVRVHTPFTTFQIITTIQETTIKNFFADDQVQEMELENLLVKMKKLLKKNCPNNG